MIKNKEGFIELFEFNQTLDEGQLSAADFPLLEGVSPLSLRVLNQATRVMNVAKGVEMMKAGDIPHDLYFIAKGSIAITKTYDGKKQIVAHLKAGNFYGEYGGLRGKTRFATVYTAEPSVILCVSLKAVLQVIDADECFKMKIFSVMRQRVLNSFLFNHVVFRDFPPAIRDVLSNKLTVTELKRNETLFEQGDEVENHYIILSGEAEIYVDKDDTQLLLEIRRDNGILGETRTDSGTKYAYTVRAENVLDLLLLDKDAMRIIKQADPRAVEKLNELLATQVKKTVSMIQSTNA